MRLSSFNHKLGGCRYGCNFVGRHALVVTEIGPPQTVYGNIAPVNTDPIFGQWLSILLQWYKNVLLSKLAYGVEFHDYKNTKLTLCQSIFGF